MALGNEITILVKAEVDKAIKDIGKIKGQTTNLGKSTGGVLSKIKGSWLAVTAVITASIVVFKKFIKTAKEFESAIARVASVAGKEATPALKKFAREAAVVTKFTAKEAADALFFLASAGLKVKDMAKVLTPALNLATAANLEIAEATDLVVGQLKTYQADMSKAADFADILTKANQLANTDVRQLGEALKFVSPLAKGLKIPFEDLNIVIAGMADIGIKGGLAGTQLRQAFSRLIAPTGAAKDILEEYGITQREINDALDDPIKLFELLEPVTKNAADATKVFGVRQQGVIALIRDQIPRLKELQEGMKDYGGAAKSAADIQLDTLEGQMKLLNSAFQEVILSLTSGVGIVPALKNLVKNITKVTIKFGEFIKSTKGIKTINASIAILKLLIKATAEQFLIFGRVFKVLISPIIESVKALNQSFLILRDSTLSPIEKLKQLKNVGIDALKGIKDTVIETAQSQIDSFKGFGDSAIEIYTAFTETVKAQNIEQVEDTNNKNQAIIENENNKNEILKEKDNDLTLSKILNIDKLTKKQIEDLDKILTHTKTFNDSITKISDNLLQTEINKLKTIDEADTAAREKQKKKITELAKANKAVQFATASIDAVTAIVKTMSSVPFPLNIPLALAQGIAGATQLALIESQEIPSFQRGGISAGGLALVGEAGTELAQLPRGTQIFNNRETKEILREGGITIQNLSLPNVIDPPTFFEAMQNFQRENGILQTES